jgi:hypothetical protein
MSGLLVHLFLSVLPAIANPQYFAQNSPQCIAFQLSRLNPLPLVVVTPIPPCPWSPDDAAVVEIGRYVTAYSWWNFDRSANLERAAANLDGAMLMPGEELSFNAAVGERTLDAGFRKAKVIERTGYTEGVGGGICQAASTVHAAALMAGLDVAERWPHRFRVPYITPGLDATVDYGKKDLRVINNTEYPVVFLVGRLEKGELMVRVMAPVRTFRVRYKYEVLEEVPSDVVNFTADPKAKDRVEYFGRPGLTLKKTLWRTRVASGETARIRVPEDKYYPSPWSLRVPKLPSGKSSLSGQSPADIARYLAGTRYSVAMARFQDVDRDNKKYVPWPSPSEKRMKLFTRFSDLNAPKNDQEETLAAAFEEMKQAVK